MRDDFQIAFTGVDEIYEGLDKYEQLLETELFQIILRGISIIANEAAMNAPVNLGNLRNQIFEKVISIDEDEFTVALGSWVHYAYYVHEGTDHSRWQGKRVPRAMAEGIRPWANDKGLEGLEYAIARAIINRGGLPPNPYLINALEAKFDEFLEYVFTELDNLSANVFTN